MPTETPVRGTTELHQILAVRDSAKSTADKTINAAYKTIQKAEPFGGIRRTHQPFDDQEQPLPAEYKHVQVQAESLIRDFNRAMCRLFDVTAAVDYTNQSATADVVLPDGTVLIHDAPATYLIFLEKQLIDVRTFIEKLPTLDPAIEWNQPEAPGAPFTSVPVQTNSTKKVLRNHNVAPATDKHAAQVQVYQEDVAWGRWTTVKLSGALPPAEVAGMQARVSVLIEAVKLARGKANTQQVDDPKPGNALLSYVFAG